MKITEYHAHVYYDVLTRPTALEMQQELTKRYGNLTRVSHMFDRLAGPHTQMMFEIDFAPDLLTTVLPWLMLNHGIHSILIHPVTGNERLDHLHHGLWLGAVLALDESKLED